MLVYLIMGGEFYGAGGWAKYIRLLAYYLTNNGQRVKIVCKKGNIFSVGADVNTESYYKITTHVLKSGKASLLYLMTGAGLPNPLTVFLGAIKLAKDIKCERDSQKVLHVHDIDSSLLIGFLIKKLFKLPLIVQIHGFPLKELKIELMETKPMLSNFIWFLTMSWHTLALKIIKNHATLVLVNNDEVKHFYSSCNIRSKKLEVIKSAINLKEYKQYLLERNEARSLLGLSVSKDMFVIGYIGALSLTKNVKTLIKAFSDIQKTYPEMKVKLLIIGNGPMRPILEECVKRYGIDGYVSFLGYIPDAYRFLNAMDIFVLPSLSEGSPIALIEAMACGKAIIASDIPAIKEMVEDGKEALLFNPYSSEQLKEAILKLYRNSELRRALGENAKKKAEQYDVNVVFSKIVKIYQKVLRIK
jgi:glycosyltransferase involved in cell wall biosynthesis